MAVDLIGFIRELPEDELLAFYSQYENIVRRVRNICVTKQPNYPGKEAFSKTQEILKSSDSSTIPDVIINLLNNDYFCEDLIAELDGPQTKGLLSDSDLIKTISAINELLSQLMSIKARYLQSVDRENNAQSPFSQSLSNITNELNRKIEATNEVLKATTGIVNDFVPLFEDEKIKQEKALAKNQEMMIEIERKMEVIPAEIEEISCQVEEDYQRHVKTIKEREKEIIDLLGVLSEKTLAGDFKSSATAEKTAAEWLRGGAIFFMLLLVALVGYSFWETTQGTFSLETALSRFVFTIFLSVPAAYLARESAKHRQQQYAFHQTALDLAALNPYIASLPEDQQHKIKAEIASKLFCAKDFKNVGKDPYPLNTHELMMAMVNKFDVKPAEKATADQSAKE